MRYSLSNADFVRVMRLIDECGEMWSDALAWQGHVVETIENLVGGYLGVLILSDRTTATPRMLDMTISRSAPANVVELLASFPTAGESQVPGCNAIRPHLVNSGWFADTLACLGGNRYRCSDFYDRYMRPLHAHDTLCAVALRASTDSAYCSPNLSVSRSPGDAPFSERDRHVLAAVASALNVHIGRRLATPTQVGRHSLSERQAQTLDRLLEGDSEKQIAANLGLSTSTVHEHVSALYRQFRVHSRGELAAFFLRRRALPLKTESRSLRASPIRPRLAASAL